MKALLLTISLLASASAFARTQTITCSGGGISLTSRIDVTEPDNESPIKNELTGLWTRPDGGPLSRGFIHLGPNNWSARGEMVTQVVFSDNMANYQLQIPGDVAGAQFGGMRSVLVVSIETQSHTTASNGYDLICSSSLN